MSINEAIRFAREKKGISQRELGRRINKTGQYISYLEKSATANPGIELLTEIAEALEIPLSELLGIDRQETLNDSITNAPIEELEDNNDNPDILYDKVGNNRLDDDDKIKINQSLVDAVFDIFDHYYNHSSILKGIVKESNMTSRDLFHKDKFLLSALSKEFGYVVKSRVLYMNDKIKDKDTVFVQSEEPIKVTYFDGEFRSKTGKVSSLVKSYELGKKDDDLDYAKFIIFDKLFLLLKQMPRDEFIEFVEELNYFMQNPSEAGYFTQGEILSEFIKQQLLSLPIK